jgi:hypothetical protein
VEGVATSFLVAQSQRGWCHPPPQGTGCYFMSLQARVWAGEHEQGSIIKSFLKYFSHIDKKI